MGIVGGVWGGGQRGKKPLVMTTGSENLKIYV